MGWLVKALHSHSSCPESRHGGWLACVCAMLLLHRHPVTPVFPGGDDDVVWQAATAVGVGGSGACLGPRARDSWTDGLTG